MGKSFNYGEAMSKDKEKNKDVIEDNDINSSEYESSDFDSISDFSDSDGTEEEFDTQDIMYDDEDNVFVSKTRKDDSEDEDDSDIPNVEFVDEDDEQEEVEEEFRKGGYSDDVYKARTGAAVRNEKFERKYVVEKPGLTNVGSPEELALKLESVGYQCLPFNAAQVALLLNSPTDSVRSILLEGPSGCGKSFMAKCLAKITGAEMMCLTCYPGMDLQHLIEYPSTLAMANAMTGRLTGEKKS